MKDHIKKTQIDSMIEFFKWILPTSAMADWIPIKIKHDYKGYANEFFNAGYRKIDKDSLVLSKTDFDLILPPDSVVVTSGEYEKLKKGIKVHNYTAMFDGAQQQRILELENRLHYTYKQAREETIKEVVQKLKTKFAIRKSFLMLNKDYAGLINIVFDSIYTDFANLAKELGVDVWEIKGE